MRKQITISFLLLSLFLGSFAMAQVKIGDNPQTIDPASVLELESTERVLVITRVDSVQMSNITPNRGALVYNTSADCIFYYNGTDWINLCGGDGAVTGFTTDPIVNDSATIVITPTPTGGNIEIAKNSINSSQIIDGGINGIDIQNGSIGRGKLQNNSVDRTKLAENSVGPFAIDNDSIDLNDFNNVTGFIRNADVISVDADNAITTGDDGGAFYDDTPLRTAIGLNTVANIADTDEDATNELTDIAFDSISNILSLINGATTEGSTVDLSSLAGGGISGGDDNQNLGQAILDSLNVLTINIENGDPAVVNLNTLAGGGGGGGTTEEVDGITLTGIGTTDDPIKIEPGPEGQFLATNTDGEVIWSNLPPSGGGGDGGAIISDETLSGDGRSAASALSIGDGAITTAKILDGQIQTNDIADANVTNTKIAPGAADQILRTSTDGFVVEWVNFPEGTGDGGTDDQNLTLAGNILEIENGNTVDFTPLLGSGGSDNQILTLTGNVVEIEDGNTIDLTPILGSGGADGSETVIDVTNSTVGVAGTGTTIDPYVLTATAGDGSETIIDVANSTIGVGGTGTTLDPYVLTATAGDGSETIIDVANSTVRVAGTGTTIDPYVLTATAGDGSETIIDVANSTVGVAGTGTTIDPYVLTAVTADGSETIIDVTNSTVGVSGLGTTANPYILTATTVDGSETRIDATNSTVGVTGSGTTIDPYILTNGASPLTNGSIFIGDVSNNPVAKTITGDANMDNAGVLTIANNVIGSAELASNAVTPANISPSTTDGQVLTTTITGPTTNVVWAGAPNLSGRNLQQTAGEDRTYNLNGSNLAFIGTGNIGIGNTFVTIDPANKLDVDGQIRARGGFAATAGTSGNPGYGFYTGDNTDMGMFRAGVDQIGFSTQGIEVMRIDENQNVGLGTINPSEKLHVIGNILASGTRTPDYVFQKYYEGQSASNPKYELVTLSEIESFTKKHKHLPGVPSAKDVKKRGGLLINKATEINLEKIEELFLHTIEQEKKINQLQSQKETLFQEVKALRNDLEEIKSILKKSE